MADRLPTQPTEAELSAAAHRAAEAWGLDVTGLSLISLSENAVFRVDTGDGRRQVLRLHRPGYNSRAEMESELVWVEALRSAGIAVPAPRRLQPAAGGTRPGPGYVEVDVGGPGGQRRLAGVIEWVDGTILDELIEADPTTAPGHYRRVGALLAGLRRHGAGWDPPPGFRRRRWDADGLVGPDPVWGRFWEAPDDPAHRDLFARARAELHRRLSALPTDRSAFGLLHADLHTRNVLIDGERATIIDFDDAGWGWWVHELAVALHPLVGEPTFDEALRALIEGYRTVHPLGEDEVALVPTFLAIRMLMLVSWLNDRPELPLYQQRRWFTEQAAEFVEAHLAR